MSPELAGIVSTTPTAGSPEFAATTEPTIIEQLDQKTAEYYDYDKRAGHYSALESEFVQEFISVAKVGVVAEALERLFQKNRLLAEPLGFTAFMRKVLEVQNEIDPCTAESLSNNICTSFLDTQALIYGVTPLRGGDVNLRANKERAYTHDRLHELTTKLAEASPQLRRPEPLVALGHAASARLFDLLPPEPDDTDAKTNGFEAAKSCFDRAMFESDITNNDNSLIIARLSCEDSAQAALSEIDQLLADEAKRIESEIKAARDGCTQMIQDCLGSDCQVTFSGTSIDIEGQDEIMPGMTMSDGAPLLFDPELIAARQVYWTAYEKRVSDLTRLFAHDKINRLQYSAFQHLLV